ncbi:MAG TPA: ABC transporter transmembrane domain-containing protein, partial [Ornithinicoccus sp.]|nr:ABC transporter transmembrane domain-containing protein [Ornithinicoccus sp.]
MDVMPELLIGAAIDVVVRGADSFVADVIGVSDRATQLVWLAVINAVVWVLESLSDYLASLTWRNLAQQVEHDLRLESYAHVQALDMAWHEARPTGSTLAVLNDDINQLERFLDSGVDKLWQVALNVVLVGAVFAASSWTLTLLAFLPIPVIVVGSLWFQRRLTTRYAAVRAAVARISGLVSANLGGMATIKTFTAEERELARVREASEHYRRTNAEAIKASAAFVPLIRMAILAGFTTTLLLGGWYALDGRLEVGLYSVLVFMTQR